MYNVRKHVQASLGQFRMENFWFTYNGFVPRLFNWCLELGFDPQRIMPSRAFCSDESQGYPVMLMAKHFGIFPFNHGQVGGIMACDRHAPHAHHGKDLVIVHASHVGYDPDTWKFGRFTRLKKEQCGSSSSCGKIYGTLKWYTQQYDYACNHIHVQMRKDHCKVTIDNQYLSRPGPRSLALHLDKMVDHNSDGDIIPISTQSNSRTFYSSEHFRQHMSWFFNIEDGKQPIGDALLPEYFHFRTGLEKNKNENHQLEKNLVGAMPWIVSSVEPMLTAAQANTQAEFDRAYRSISQDPAYRDRNLLYISGLHVDISPKEGQHFVLTKFIPWAAYVQTKEGDSYILEQEELFEQLNQLNEDNPYQLNFDEAIELMEDADPVYLHLPY